MKKTLTLLLFSLISSLSYAQNTHSFFEPYGKDWFIDLKPKDRGVSGALISALRGLLGKDSLRQVSMSVLPNPAGKRPNLYVLIASFTRPSVLQTYMLSYDQGSNTYLSVAQPYNNQPPQIFLTFPGPGQAQMTSMNVDINGDGIPDRIEGAQATMNGYNPTAPPSLDANIKIYLGTDVGQIDDSKITLAVFDYRIGYIAGYTNSYNNYISKLQLPADQSGTGQQLKASGSDNQNKKNDATAPGQPLTQDLVYDPSSICTRYDTLADRQFLDNQRNQFLLIGLRRGFTQGLLDAKDVAAKIKTLAAFKANILTARPDTAAAHASVNEYINMETDLYNDLLDKPLYRITFKNRITGETIKLVDLAKNKSIDVPKVDPKNSSLAAFVMKMTRPVGSGKSAPFFKLADSTGNWYVMSPAMLSGQVSAYVNILSIVNSADFLTQLQAKNDATDFWNNLTDSFQQNLTNYSQDDVKKLSTSLFGITSLEYREGYRNVSSYISHANTQVSKKQGSQDAVKEIIAFMKANYSQFNPPGDITTPAQAEAAIAGFVNGLYDTINQLDNTINNLNTLLVNANNTVTQLQGLLTNANNTINDLHGAVSNVDRFTNVVANTAEVAYWGSSVGLTYSAGKWLSNAFHIHL